MTIRAFTSTDYMARVTARAAAAAHVGDMKALGIIPYGSHPRQDGRFQRGRVKGLGPLPAVDLYANGHDLPGMPGNLSSAFPPSLKWLLALVLACLLVWAAWTYRQPSELQRGAELYAEHCATCHGAQLEGQPDWQIADENGVLPAPPHDATGHTWHHDDAMLTDYIRRGGQTVLDDMGVAMTSGMPAFGEILEENEITAILAFIKSSWPARIQAVQAERNGD